MHCVYLSHTLLRSSQFLQNTSSHLDLNKTLYNETFGCWGDKQSFKSCCQSTVTSESYGHQC